MRWTILLIALSNCAIAQAGQCAAQSPGRTVALVELYTSQGCGTCAPADRWLASLAEGFAPDRVLPLALHTDYWDYTGWKDPQVRAAHAARQRKMPRLARAAMVYSPRVLLQGREFPAWGSALFQLEVDRINARPPGASITLRLARGFTVEAEASLATGVPPAEAALFLAAYEDKAPPGAGQPEYVVLEWAGPVPFRGPRLLEKRVLPLLPQADPARSGVVAFVQDRATAEVLQALHLPACPG